jgi:peptidoglycan/LPS O-acetylase OafA/YrhL
VRDGESVGSFLRRRSLRIYPAYWCSVAIVAALPFIIEGISTLKTGTFVRPSAAGNINMGFLEYGVGEWLRVLTLTQVFATVPGATNLQFKFTTINAVYWTLAIEFQFYLVMAVALALRSRAVVWLAAITLLSLPMWYLSLWKVQGIFLPYWPMFAIGVALYLALERGFSLRGGTRAHRVIQALAPALLIGAFVAATESGHQVDEVTFALGFALTLWSLHRLDEDYRNALRSGSRTVQVGLGGWKLLGLMSYSLYLLHGRLQFLADQFCRQILPKGIALDFAVIAVTCALCYVFYRCCERPFIQSRVVPQAAAVPVFGEQVRV